MASRMIQNFVRTLTRQGIAETARRTWLHFGRKRAEQQFVRNMRLSEAEKEAQRKASFTFKPLISIIVPLYNTPPDLLRETLQSVLDQTYGNWELCLADGSDGEHVEVGEICRKLAEREPRIRYEKLEKNEGISGNSNAALAMASGEYLALFDHDDLLTENALYEVAKVINAQEADFIYSDELIFVSPNREKLVGIRFKPDYSPDFLLTNNYICHLTCFSRKLLQKAGPFRSAFDGSQDHDLILRLTGCAERVVHIPKVLYLWRSIPSSVASDIYAKEYAIDAGRRAVKTFLREHRGMDAEVVSTEIFPTMYRVKYPIEGSPSVRLVVDAASERDPGNVAERMKALLDKTNTASAERIGVTLIQTAGASPAARLNGAARETKEDYLLFVSGIPEVVTPDWIQEMLMLAQQEHVGAVGVRVHFQRGNVRHAGVVLGLGKGRIAGRPYRGREDETAGYFGQLAVVQNVSAVADCLMVSREKFESAGGFSEDFSGSLAVTDLCLKLREKGYYNVVTPFGLLKGGKASEIPMEIGKNEPGYEQDAARFREKWSAQLKRGDPFYNANLSLDHEDWRIRT